MESSPSVFSRDCPNHPNGIYVQSLSLSLPSSAVKIFLCLLLIGFIPVCRIGLVGDFVIKYPYFAFAASSWAFMSFPISFAILTTVGTCDLVLLLLQHP